MAEDEALPDDLRCKRTDGRQWRCKRRVMDDKKLCDIHYLQGRHRQNKEKVPEDLKLDRKPRTSKRNGETSETRSEIRANPNGEGSSKATKKRVVKKRKKRSVDISEALDCALKKMKFKKGDLHLDLIRGFLKRVVEKKKEKQMRIESEGEVVKEKKLPYGTMIISQLPSTSQTMTNAGLSNVKVGFSSPNLPMRRCFRSKNIEPLPIGTMQMFPRVQTVVKKRKKCHWCRKSSYRVIVKCLKCKKQFFCVDCIQERCLDKKVVKRECPVCCGTCSCRSCSMERPKKNKHKEVCEDKHKVGKLQRLLFVIHTLLPLLEQINKEKSIELDLECKIKGTIPVDMQIKLTEIGSKTQQCCNHCKTSIVDCHRSCRNCSYNLCLSCCGELREGDLDVNISAFMSKLRKWKVCDDGSINCPPKSLGGCGQTILELKCRSPLNWTKELEESAKELVCEYKYLKLSDKEYGRKKLLRLVGEGEGVYLNNDLLYLSSRQGRLEENLEHFRKQWSKGHPLILRDVLPITSDISWDPLVMFCTYLEGSGKNCIDKEPTASTKCLDWCEMEIARKQIFVGSLDGMTQANVCREVLKFKVWLSSCLFQKQFPTHYTEMMSALPLQDFISPMSGFLNLAAVKLPQEMPNADLGPSVYISYGPEEVMRAESLTKLCYNSYDMVDMLAHATDIPVSDEQLSTIKKLMNEDKGKDNNEVLENTKTNIEKPNEENGKSSLDSEHTQQSSSQDMPNVTTCMSVFSHENGPEFDSEASALGSGTNQRYGDSDNEGSLEDATERSSYCREKRVVDSSGAQWDIFRREDIPKLVEYLKKHSNEFDDAYYPKKKVVHPILDQSFFLDTFHKRRLKEEFDIEPWTFEQHIGEAVVIPAGCPYQIRKLKVACVNVVLEFISPESAVEGIKLNDELRLLPLDNKAKGKTLEIKTMSLYSISAAIEEIHNLTATSSSTFVKSQRKG